MRPWHLGNTTVRSPFRLRDGLIALSNSDLEGNLRGSENDASFRQLLGGVGLVKLGEDETNSVGRKWRVALTQLGFLYSEQSGVDQVDRITPSGRRLIKSENVPAIQECFLRSLAIYQIPSPLEDYSYSAFSPLRHVLNILFELSNNSLGSYLTFQEVALIVQVTSPTDNLRSIIEAIKSHRKARGESTNKRRFDQLVLDQASNDHGYKPQTFNDYADVNIRYFKATGLFISKGRGITINPQKEYLAKKLIKDYIVISDDQYLEQLSLGATLPTDNPDNGSEELNLLVGLLKKEGIIFNTSDINYSNPADIAIARHKVEELLGKQKEIDFAKKQAKNWREIALYLELISSRRNSGTISEEREIRFPRSEIPAYLEWALWRAFLAINKLKNQPYESRKFKVDQDILPIGNAPGNGPDLIFEFDDYVLVVEATLTDNSRQEAVEGEPVRRHVANCSKEYENKKPVYGLFVANNIDSNTAETFRTGVWYNSNDEKDELAIVPVTLSQFKLFFEFLFTNDKVDNQNLLKLLELCLAGKREISAPEWKTEISSIILNYCKQ